MCAITPPASVLLPADDHAPGVARRFLSETVCRPHGAAVLEEAQLLVSELVTNAVRHGAPPVRVTLLCDESTGMVARVTDASGATPRRMTADATAEAGRGVALVDLLSDAWGVDSIPGDGKVVWFRMRR